MGILRWNQFSKKDPRKFGWNIKSPDSKQFCSFWKRAPRTNKWNSSRPETCLQDVTCVNSFEKMFVHKNLGYMLYQQTKLKSQRMDKRTCCCQVLRMTLLEKMLHDNYMCFIYLSADLYNCKSTSLENVFSRLYLIHFTELCVWICPMIFIRTPVPWASLDILSHGLYFTWY